MRKSFTTPLASFVALLIVLACGPLAATAQQSLQLSKHADFSTRDRLFSTTDTLYVRLVAKELDASAVAQSELRLQPDGEGETYEATLVNHLDGTFTAAVPLADLEGAVRSWLVRVRIEDDEREQEARAAIVIHGRLPEQASFVVRGRVEAVAGTDITLAGRTIRLTGETQFVGGPRTSDLVGKEVTVRVRPDADGALVALTVVVKEASQARLEMTGLISAVTATSIRVRDLTFAVGSQTEVRSEQGLAVSLLSLRPGVPVKVTAQQVGGAWVATRIEVLRARDAERPEELEVRGIVSAASDSVVVVAGVRLVVTPATRLDGFARAGALTPGSEVEARFIVRGDTNIALRIELEDEEDGDDDGEEKVEAEGEITAVLDGAIEVGGITFTVDERTRIEARHLARLTLADLFAGLAVEVKGFVMGDGSVRAVLIRIERELETEVKVRGEITAVADSLVTIDSTSFYVTSETRIKGERGARLGLGDLAVGQFAKAELAADLSGALFARKIEVEDRFEPEDVAVTGRVEAVTASSIQVGDVSFAVTADTRIESTRGDSIGLADVQVGQMARVKGFRAADSSLVATEIRLRGQIHAEGRLEGTVTAVDDTSVVVAGVGFRLSAQTRVEGGASALQAGQRVDVRFRQLGDSSRFAVRVQVREGDEADEPVRLKGVLQAVAAGGLVVSGIDVAVTPETVLIGRGGAVITLASLQPGQPVEIRAVVEAGGLVALRVESRQAVVLEAVVSARANGTLHVAGRQVRLTQETLVLGPDGRVLSPEAVRAGAFVEVVAVSETSAGAGKTAEETLVADRVTVQSTQAVTGIEAPADVPSTFVLEGNYPNPFNPTTTISFVTQAQAGPVRLTIYNVLGQRVRTLVAGELAPGRHTYTWDGRDDAGRMVASGTYLYRLEVAGQAQARTMTLLK